MRANRPYVIGITGGIASGKSGVSCFLRELGEKVIIADEIARLAQKELKGELINAFGKDIADENGDIDRAKLRQLVFNHKPSLDRLNGLMHPKILQMLENEIKAFEGKRIFLEVPLLFETGFQRSCDKIWCVYTGEAEQKKRLIRRNSLDEALAQKIIDSQMREADRLKLSDEKIFTLYEKENTRKQVENLLKKLDLELSREE